MFFRSCHISKCETEAGFFYEKNIHLWLIYILCALKQMIESICSLLRITICLKNRRHVLPLTNFISTVNRRRNDLANLKNNTTIKKTKNKNTKMKHKLTIFLTILNFYSSFHLRTMNKLFRKLTRHTGHSTNKFALTKQSIYFSYSSISHHHASHNCQNHHQGT